MGKRRYPQAVPVIVNAGNAGGAAVRALRLGRRFYGSRFLGLAPLAK